MKAIFYGTPAIAVPFLELLSSRENVVAVVTQPDKPAGRSLELTSPPVKNRAQELSLPIFQPEKPAQIAVELKSLKADLAIAVAYGRLLKADALAAPRLGTLNVHFSLLPHYRGAAPAQWALVRGEARTGVTLFWLDEGMDTGPIQMQRETAIAQDENAEQLLQRLTKLGLEALAQTLDDIAAGHIRQEPQQGTPSLAPLLKKEDGRISFNREARQIHDLVRGLHLWPRAFVDLAPSSGSSRLLVLKTELEAGSENNGKLAPGSIVRVERGRGILVQCQGSQLWLVTVQPEGKRPVDAADFLNGLRLGAGNILPLR